VPASQVISAIALGIGLSACCGFRVFIPLLVGSVAAYFHWIPLNAEMSWLATVPAIISFGTAAVFEVSAYYIPFIDNILDAVATPLAMLAGTAVAVSVLPVGHMDPLLQWGLGLLAGGAPAGTIQVGSGLLRLFSSKTTAGAGNSVIATGENLFAVMGSLGSLVVPVLVAIFLLAFCVFLAFRVVKQILRPGGKGRVGE